MESSLLERARRTEHFAGAVRELANHLPDDDAALERALGEAVAQRDGDAFTHLLFAAFEAGRPVDARFLGEGAPLLPRPEMLVAAAVSCEGDVASALVGAVRDERLKATERAALALVLAAWWSRERAGTEAPEDLIYLARTVARRARSFFAMDTLLALCEYVEDDGLLTLMRDWDDPEARVHARQVFEEEIGEAENDPLRGFPAEQPATVLSGYTVRRAAARVGRNEPCPCGSGKKYKKCCVEKDQERLRHSSEVAGMTVDELREDPEAHLTKKRLWNMPLADLLRLDPARIASGLRPMLLRRLTMHDELQAVVSFFETVGFDPEYDDDLLEAMDEAAHRRDAGIVRRLLEIRGDRGGEREQPGLAVRLIADGLEPGSMLKCIEDEAHTRVDSPNEVVNLAYTLLEGPCPALGILVARGALQQDAHPLDCRMLLDVLLETRDRLRLSPEDPAEEALDGFWEKEDDIHGAATEPDDEVRARLEEKLVEVRRLRSDLRERTDKVRSLERRVGELAASEPDEEPEAEPDAGASEDPRVGELRRRLVETRTELKQRHAERNEARTELSRARREVERLRTVATAPASDREIGDEQEEQTLMLPEDTLPAQPARLPVFARKFTDVIPKIPDPVARGALRLIGQLAAGAAPAFRGARRLRVNREIWRQRVGSDYRLLFRPGDGTLDVLALVSRQDFPRFVRSLD